MLFTFLARPICPFRRRPFFLHRWIFVRKTIGQITPIFSAYPWALIEFLFYCHVVALIRRLFFSFLIIIIVDSNMKRRIYLSFIFSILSTSSYDDKHDSLNQHFKSRFFSCYFSNKKQCTTSFFTFISLVAYLRSIICVRQYQSSQHVFYKNSC